MAAKGAASKQVIINKLIEVFPGSFLCPDGKEFRIPMMESGEPIEIKVALTCAKTNMGGGDANFVAPTEGASAVEALKSTMPEPTAEEKKRVEDLVHKLGLA